MGSASRSESANGSHEGHEEIKLTLTRVYHLGFDHHRHYLAADFLATHSLPLEHKYFDCLSSAQPTRIERFLSGSCTDMVLALIRSACTGTASVTSV